MPGFDPVVFDVGTFESLYPIPILYEVYVPREQQRIAAGQGVSVTVTLVNVETTPYRRYPLNPEGPVTLDVYDPTDTKIIAGAVMVNHAPGLYGYQFQVGLVGADTTVFDPLVFDTSHTVILPGPYTGTFRATNGTRTMQSKKHRLFEVI